MLGEKIKPLNDKFFFKGVFFSCFERLVYSKLRLNRFGSQQSWKFTWKGRNCPKRGFSIDDRCCLLPFCEIDENNKNCYKFNTLKAEIFTFLTVYLNSVFHQFDTFFCFKWLKIANYRICSLIYFSSNFSVFSCCPCNLNSRQKLTANIVCNGFLNVSFQLKLKQYAQVRMKILLKPTKSSCIDGRGSNMKKLL